MDAIRAPLPAPIAGRRGPGAGIASDRQPEWMGAFRPKPGDGVSPAVRDYDTGLPTQGVKIEEKVQKF